MTDSGGTPRVASEAIPPDLRDCTVDALTRGFASDRLSESELEMLLDPVYGVTTLTELDALIRDLPVLGTASDVGIGSAVAEGSGHPVASAAPDQKEVHVVQAQRTGERCIVEVEGRAGGCR